MCFFLAQNAFNVALFGLLAGVLASKWLAEPRVPKGEEPYTPEPWELDEPWNIA